MKRRLAELGEITAGALLWWGGYAWGAILGVIFVCAPLLVACLVTEVRPDIPATVAMGGGVVGAYALDMPPWHAEELSELPLLVGGAAVSAVAFDLVRGSADVATLVVAIGLTIVGWPLRRMLTRRGLTLNADR